MSALRVALPWLLGLAILAWLVARVDAQATVAAHGSGDLTLYLPAALAFIGLWLALDAWLLSRLFSHLGPRIRWSRAAWLRAATYPVMALSFHLANAKLVADKAGHTILLVKDEEIVAEIGRQMLQRLGHRVLLARIGAEALALYEQHRAEIDLVILDMILPGMSGSTVFDRLRAINPGVPVLLSSGYSLNGQALDILQRGCRGFIQKPFSIEQLELKISECLSGS